MTEHRFATVAVVGRPNVGKSTLLNAMIGFSLSIVAPKPQTTRHRVLGVLTRPAVQFAFLDTPGIHRAQARAMNKMLNKTAFSALDEADIVLWLIDATRRTEEDEIVATRLRDRKTPVVIALNKIDKIADKGKLLPIIESLQADYAPAAIVPISALKESGVESVLKELARLAPVGDAQFESDEITDRSERFLAAERVREQLILQLHDELPYATSVEIERWEQEGNLIKIGAVIWVERDAQKAIVIGAGGAQLKAIGTRARKSLEKLLDARIHLETWVRVRENWSDDERALKRMGMDQA
jgi:GTP-binding protein Era